MQLTNIFKWTFLEIVGAICIQTFYHISSGDISKTCTLIQAIFSQYLHTSFGLESAFSFICCWLTILSQYCTQPYLVNISLQYIISGIEINITYILPHMICNLMKYYIMCLRPLKQCISWKTHEIWSQVRIIWHIIAAYKVVYIT